MNTPARLDMPKHYKGNGMKPFSFTLRYKGTGQLPGNPVDLTESTVIVEVMEREGASPAWLFSTAELNLEKRITVDPTAGVITMPEINSWPLPAGTYAYHLRVIDREGYVRTYLKGKWGINQNILY